MGKPTFRPISKFPQELFEQILKLNHKSNKLKTKSYIKHFCKFFFCYPLIDHDRCYSYVNLSTRKNRVHFIVSYAYIDQETEEQLEQMRQELRSCDAEALLQVVKCQWGLKDMPKKPEVYKVIISNTKLDEEKWNHVKKFKFDDREFPIDVI
jgi:hypothetical protein